MTRAAYQRHHTSVEIYHDPSETYWPYTFMSRTAVAYTLDRGHWPDGIWLKMRWDGRERMFRAVTVDGEQRLISRDGKVMLRAYKVSEGANPQLRSMKPGTFSPWAVSLRRVNVDPAARALRPVRLFKTTGLRVYEATTFPNGPRRGCALWLMRCAFLDYLRRDDANIVLDVLDEHGDIVQDFPLTRRGFKYLRKRLKFKVVDYKD